MKRRCKESLLLSAETRASDRSIVGDRAARQENQRVPDEAVAAPACGSGLDCRVKGDKVCLSPIRISVWPPPLLYEILRVHGEESFLPGHHSGRQRPAFSAAGSRLRPCLRAADDPRIPCRCPPPLQVSAPGLRRPPRI